MAPKAQPEPTPEVTSVTSNKKAKDEPTLEPVEFWLLHLTPCTTRGFSAGLNILLNIPTATNTMKHITKLGNNRYIHLDSYGEYRSSISKLLMATFVLAIAAITAGAMVGIDITNINPTPTQHQSKWTPT